jgi:hypothetical protein
LPFSRFESERWKIKVATLAGQRAQFAWALNQYNLAENAEQRAHFAKRMAKYIAAAPTNGFTVDDVTQGQVYPAAEVNQYIDESDSEPESEITEGEALKEVAQAVDVSDVVRLGQGLGVVYAYGYRCSSGSSKDRADRGGYDTTHRCANQHQHAR